MTDSQPQSPAEALQRAVRDLGRRVSENPDRVRAVLSDGLGAAGREHRAAIDALALASEEGIPATLLAREDSVLTETDLVDDDQRLVVRLTDRGLDPEVATFAIGTWAMALGTDSTLTSASSRGPVGPPSTGSAGAGTPPATELPFGLGRSTEETPPPADAPRRAGTGDGVITGGGAGTGDRPGRGDQVALRVARVRRGLVAAAVVATLAVVGGTAWSSFRTPSRDAALLVDATRTSTTSSAGPSTTSGPAVTTTLPPKATSAPAKRPTVAATTKKPVVKPSAPQPTKATPRPVATTPRATLRSSASPAPVRTTPKKTFASKPSTPRSSTSTKPKPPPPAPKTLTAGNGTHSWTMSYWDGSSCLDWAGAGAQVCSRFINTIKGGTVSTWQVADAVSVNGHGDVVVSGQRVQYFPHHNGYIQDVIRYRLSGAGVTSNWATLTVTAHCNTNYACFGE